MLKIPFNGLMSLPVKAITVECALHKFPINLYKESSNM